MVVVGYVAIVRTVWMTIWLLACAKAPKHAGGNASAGAVDSADHGTHLPGDGTSTEDTAGASDTANGAGPGGQDSAETGDTAGAPDTGVPAGGELRGIWVTRWTYSSVADIETIMADIASAGFNTVFFQVRGRYDAFYDSRHEPWAKELTGTLGQDPGWDPLLSAVSVGHAHGLAVHAYINVFPLWSGATAPTASSPQHAYLTHPDWLVADDEGTPMALNDSYVFASPGHPDVRQRVADVASDIAGRYEVDGIHLDYIRYPGSDYSHDVTSLYHWELAGSPDWADWQRAQINATVQGVSAAVGVPVTAAVWGIYENSWGWSSVSQGNVDYYQDSRAFLADGLLDANIPMIYWPVAEVEGDRLDFRTLVRDHVAHASGRHVYAGISADPDIGLDGVVRCIEAARLEGAHGVVVFDYSQAREWMTELRSTVFSEDAVPPAMSWR